MIKEMAAPVRKRLTNHSKEKNRPFQEVLQYFAMEGFLYRLSKSQHNNKFILKGALLFSVWGGSWTRPTKDIDFLSRMENAVEPVSTVIREICSQTVEPDGLNFDLESVEGKIIKEDADYLAVRITFVVHMQNSRIPMQIDIGFGDLVTRGAEWKDYAVFLNL